MGEREKFEKWAEENLKNVSLGEFFDLRKSVAFAAWQAALSTRKPCGFIMINCDGEAKKTFYESQLTVAQNTVKFFNENDIVGNPFRVVPLFYEDQS